MIYLIYCAHSAGTEGNSIQEDQPPASLARLNDVHVVTAADLAAGSYSAQDIVLPLPGSQTIYPANSIAEVSLLLLWVQRI